MHNATIYIFSGLPGSGKTTLAQLLARRIGAAHLQIDTIEQALRDLCSVDVQGEGYRLAYRVASDILNAGVSVVADSCNPIDLTRREWEQVARHADARYVNIEVVCSDPRKHRERVETRAATIPGLRLPTWHEVETREYHDWTVERVVAGFEIRRAISWFHSTRLGGTMDFTVESARESDGRWIAEVPELPGVLAYGASQEEALAKAQALALRVLADRLEHGEAAPTLNISFKAA